MLSIIQVYLDTHDISFILQKKVLLLKRKEIRGTFRVLGKSQQND